MSVKLIFDLPSEGGLVQRSRSFTGFSSLTGQRWPSSGRNAVRSKPLVAAKSPSWATESMSKQPPEQVDRIFRALRNGLKEYLEVHQAEMDFLSSQQRETKRNSRLAFLYDLEKEIRALERYIRRLEFHISKVEELYETYCIHWRLCQGAVNMKKAFSNSQSSRASRDSLLELSRSHRHSLQDMSSMAGELEMLLGELHIKMKGLIGFARLCPGDHYEVVVRLGRQHWRMKGRIQSDDTQLWEEEEMVFLPHIHHNFEIKVTEVKGLSRLLVGMVTCASADFFVARPQLMLVDVSELGTIKLQLEVTWNPFDSVSGERTRAVSPRRRSSSYSKISTASPSFTEKYYIAMVRQLRDPKGSLTSLVSRPRPSRGEVSLLSYLSDPTHIPANSLDCSGSHVGNAHDHLRPSTSYGSSPSPGTSLGGSQSQLEAPSEEKGEGVNEASSMPEESRYSLLPPERSSTPDILRKNPVGEPECAKLPGLGWSSAPGREPVRVQGSTEGNPAPPPAPAGAPGRSEVTETQCRVQTLRLGVLMVELENLLHNQEDPDKELRVLGNKIHHLATILKNDLSVLKKPTFTETLAVEKVLESFDFLSHDMNAEDDTSCMGSVRLKDTVSQSEEELPITPLTSGNTSLDQALEIHLDICSILIEAVGAVDFSLSRRCLLEETSLQQDVLDAVSHLMLESDNAMSTTDLLPKIPGRKELSSFWDQCVADGNPPFCCHADSFSRALRKRYTHKVKAKQPGQSERVFRELLEQIQGCWRGVPYPRSVSNPERVTLFQLSVYLKRWEIQDLGEHISRLAKEIYILSALRSSKRRRALKKLKGRVFTELLPLRVTLETLAALHTDSSLKVCHAATRCLARASVCKAFRNKAVVFYTESLKLNDVKIRQASCLALKSLRATESVEQIAEMWRSEDDDVRSAARETVLSFGKKGYSGFQKMDQLHMEMQEETYQNQYTQITVL